MSRANLVDHADHRVGRAGAPAFRAALERSDGRAESPLESRLRLVLVAAGLRPQVQFRLQREGLDVGRVDFCFEGLVVETDGFAFHSNRAAYRNDRRRNNLCARLGVLMLRFTWEDVCDRPDEVVAAVVAALARVSTLQPAVTAAPAARRSRPQAA